MKNSGKINPSAYFRLSSMVYLVTKQMTIKQKNYSRINKYNKQQQQLGTS
jgi:hypothetical protein